MSDWVQVLVRIDPLRPTLCYKVTNEIQVSLIQDGYLQRTPPRFELNAGRRLPEMVEHDTDAFEGPHGSVEFHAERKFHGGGYGHSAHCQQCGTQLEDAGFASIIEDWLDNGEPTVVCGHCNWSAPYGDWPAASPIGFVGVPAVEFRNWALLSEGFKQHVFAMLGGRCRLVAYK